MKSMRLITPVLVAVCLLVVPLAWSQGGNPPASTKESGAPSGHGMTAAEQTGKSDDALAQVKTLQKQLLQAILKADTGFFEKYYADDYTAIHGDGKLTTKAEEIANFRSGMTKYESIDVHESKARTYGDTVIVNAFAAVKTTVNGKAYSGEIRNTRVWVRQNGEWKVAAFQTTRVAPPSQ